MGSSDDPDLPAGPPPDHGPGPAADGHRPGEGGAATFAGAVLSRRYLTWSFARWMAFNGYWLAASLYLVLAGMSPLQLVLLGTLMELTVLLAEIPTGVMADTVSRKWSIVVSHGVMGVGMLATGLTTSFPLLLATQMLWGLGWTFSSGADVAWITDELDDPGRIDRILARAASLQLVGAAAGLVTVGALALATSLEVAIVAAGVTMVAIGGYVIVSFPERNFTPTRENRLAEARSTLVDGLGLAGRDPEIRLVLVVAALISLGAEAYDRLHPKRLIDLGFPDRPDPVVWFTVLGVATLILGAVALRWLQANVDGAGTPHRLLAAGCGVGVVGLLMVAGAPGGTVGVAGVLLVSGIAWNVTHSVCSIWVNRRATSQVRATVQSTLGQVGSFGEILGGVVFGTVAELGSIPLALTGSALAIAVAGLLVARWAPPARHGD